MSIQDDKPLSDYASSSLDVITSFYPYIALLVVVVSVFSIFKTRRRIRRLKEALRHSPEDKVLLMGMKMTKITQFLNYFMLAAIGVSSYLSTHIDSLI